MVSIDVQINILAQIPGILPNLLLGNEATFEAKV